MAARKTTRFQSLGDGFYRVTGVRVHPVTGRYIVDGGSSHRAVGADDSAPRPHGELRGRGDR